MGQRKPSAVLEPKTARGGLTWNTAGQLSLGQHRSLRWELEDE